MNSPICYLYQILSVHQILALIFQFYMTRKSLYIYYVFDFVIPVGCPNRVPFSIYIIHFQVNFSHLKCAIFQFLRTLMNMPAKSKLSQLKRFTATGKSEGCVYGKCLDFSFAIISYILSPAGGIRPERTVLI